MFIRALVVVCLMLLGAPASAQDLGFGPHARPTHAARVTARWDTIPFGEGMDIGGGAHTTINSWANLFSTQIDLDDVVLGLAVPLGYVSTSCSGGGPFGCGGGVSQAELGNVELEALGSVDLGEGRRLLIGGGVALPTATDQLTTSGLGGTTGWTVRTAAWATSVRNPAAWGDQSFAVWPEIAFRDAVPYFLLTATLSAPIFFPLHGSYGGAPIYRGNAEVMIQADVAAALRIGDYVDIGASFLGFATPSATGTIGSTATTVGQTAATLFVRTDDALDSPVGGGFEMILNLGPTWGPTGAPDRFWGAHIFLYARFDVGPSRSAAAPATQGEGW
jgi:hypothetical protein